MYVDSEKSGVFVSTEYSEYFDMIENFSAICPSVYKYLPKQDILTSKFCGLGANYRVGPHLCIMRNIS